MVTPRSAGRVVLLALVALALPHAMAEDLKEGSNEIVGYAGGIQAGGGAGTVGGGFGYALKSRLQLIGEIGYIGVYGGGVEFGGNLHYLIPLSAYPKFTPYLLGGVGVMHGDGVTLGGVNFGGGARWQLGQQWGVRPEIKFLAGNHFATRFSAGIYYQFGK